MRATPSWRRHSRWTRKILGWQGRPQDILRHTAASYWLAEWRDAGKVAHELGNSAGILLRHYRGVVTEEDTERFWAIRPKNAEQLEFRNEGRTDRLGSALHQTRHDLFERTRI